MIVERNLIILATVAGVYFFAMSSTMWYLQSSFDRNQRQLTLFVVPALEAMDKFKEAISQLLQRETEILGTHSTRELEQVTNQTPFAEKLIEANELLEKIIDKKRDVGDITVFLENDLDHEKSIEIQHKLQSDLEKNLSQIDQDLKSIIDHAHGISGQIRLNFIVTLRNLEQDLKDSNLSRETRKRIEQIVVGNARGQLDAVTDLVTSVLTIGMLAGKIGLAQSSDDLNTILSNEFAQNVLKADRSIDFLIDLNSNDNGLLERTKILESKFQSLVSRIEAGNEHSLANLRRRIFEARHESVKLREKTKIFSEKFNEDINSITMNLNAATMDLNRNMQMASEIGKWATLAISFIGIGISLFAGLRLRQSINELRRQNIELMELKESLADANRGLERQVEVRTAELKEQMTNVRLLLDNMKQAVFSVSEEYKVVPPMSEHSIKVFGYDISGKNVFETVFSSILEETEVYSTVKSVMEVVFGESELQWEVVAGLLPTQVKYEAPGADATSMQTLRLTYEPIYDEKGNVAKILFVIEDVTEMRRLEAEAQRTIEEIHLLQRLAKVGHRQLRSYFSTSRQTISEIQAILTTNTQEEVIKAFPILRRALHTLKGNSRVFGFKAVSETAHLVENTVVNIQDSMDSLNFTDAFRALFRDVTKIERQIFDGSRLAKKYLQVNTGFEQVFFDKINATLERADLELAAGGNVDSVLEDLWSLAYAMDSEASLELVMKNPNLNSDESRAEAGIESLRLTLLRKDMLPPLDFDAQKWVAFTLKLLELNDYLVASKGPLDAKQKNLLASLEGQTYEWKFYAVAEALGGILRGAIKIDDGLRDCWIYLGLCSSIQCLHFKSREKVQDFGQLLIHLPDSVAEAIAKLEAMRTTGHYLLTAMLALGRSGRHPKMILTTALAATGFKDVYSLFCTLSAMDDLKSCNLLFVDSDLGLSTEERLDRLKSLQSPWPQMLLAFMSRAGCPRWSYGRVSEIARFCYGAETNVGSRESEVALMEVSEVNYNALKNLVSRYDPHHPVFDLRTLSRRVQKLLDLPVKPELKRYYLMVHELAEKLGKKVNFDFSGDDVTINRDSLNLLNDALVHVVRNAVDHGIEVTDERVRAGKNEVGNIHVFLSYNEDEIKIVIEDDGRGMDPELIMSSAISKGLLTDEKAKKMSDKQKLNLLFLPGFSTKAKVTDLSGRGVGMDVLKTNVDKLNGSIDIVSEVGKGSKVTIRIKDDCIAWCSEGISYVETA